VLNVTDKFGLRASVFATRKQGCISAKNNSKNLQFTEKFTFDTRSSNFQPKYGDLKWK